MVEKKTNVISNHFINPFEKDLEQGNLFSLISGVLVNEDIEVSLLSIKEIGKEAMGDFINRLILSEDMKTLFHIKKKGCDNNVDNDVEVNSDDDDNDFDITDDKMEFNDED